METDQVSLNSDSFWKLLEASRLLSPMILQQLAQPGSQFLLGNPSAMARKLVEQKLITAYQAEILLAGHAGPFHFGNYTISGKYNDGPLAGQFKGRHTPTQHPVVLKFYPGSSAEDLTLWQNLEQRVSLLSSIKSPFFLRVFDSLVMPSYRFVVAQRPDGVTLQERLPAKSRLPWKDACTLMAQVAHGIESLHRHGAACQTLSLDSIWVNKVGFAQVQAELPTQPAYRAAIESGDPEPTFANHPPRPVGLATSSSVSEDWTSFAEILFRIISGKHFGRRSVAAAQETAGFHSAAAFQQELSKHELPTELMQLLSRLLFPSAESSSPAEVSQLLSGLAGKSLKAMLPPDQPTWSAYQTSLSNFVPGAKKSARELPQLETGVPSVALVEQVPVIINTTGELLEPNSRSPSSTVGAARSEPGPPSQLKPGLNRRRTWIPIAATLAAIWIFCGLLAWGAYYASQTAAPGPQVAQTSTPSDFNLANSNDTDNETGKGTDPLDGGVEDPAMSDAPPVLQQSLVEDDRSLLWQSPTSGPALDLSGLPSGPRIIIALRPAELAANPEGELLLKSFGPEFSQILADWEAASGTPLREVAHLLVSLHSNDAFRYEAYVRCELVKPIDSSELMRRWQAPQPQSTEDQNLYYASSDSSQGFVVLAAPELDLSRRPSDEMAKSNETEAADLIQRFGMGSLRLIAEVADAPRIGGNILQGLAERTDQQRQLNLLFLRPALFNDEGQALMAGKWAALNRELAVLLPDEVQAASLSLHLDQGTFFELQFAQTVDLKGIELQQRLEARFRDLRDRTTERIAVIPASPYWDRVRLKLNLMAVDAFRSLRWGVEHGEVVANAWLPPMAAHNLVAATELAMTFSAGASSSSSMTAGTAGAADSPQTLEALLQRKRDLKVANPPDLNLLMADLEAEIKEEFPGLPFQFRLRLMGPDLQLEGITQNQRPSELNLEQQTLSEILTRIMVSANPAKDISGASDPRCKLVWAIADDPDKAGEKMILITTRSAAQQKNYQLPSAFQTE